MSAATAQIVLAAAALFALVVCVCAVRSNRLLEEDERSPLWTVPPRDPERERREHQERAR